MRLSGRIQHWLARRAVRRRFAVLRCAGLGVLRDLPPDRAALLCPIHTSWWDGFFASCLLAKLPGRRFALAQEARHLRRYPWFRLGGVVALDGTVPGPLRDSMERLLAVLRDPSSILVFFPQGELVLQDAAPITLRRGAAWLARRAEVPVVPVVWRHGLRDSSRPELWVRIGAAMEYEGGDFAARLQETLRGMEQRLAGDWANGHSEDYQPLWPERRPVNETWWRWRKRLGGNGT